MFAYGCDYSDQSSGLGSDWPKEKTVQEEFPMEVCEWGLWYKTVTKAVVIVDWRIWDVCCLEFGKLSYR